jgi:hypothetical protein
LPSHWTQEMMQGVPETAENEAGDERKEAPPAVGHEAVASAHSQRDRYRALLWIAGGAGALALASVVAAIVLAARGGQAIPPATAPALPRPALTVVPQATSTAPPQASPSATAIPLALRQEIEQAYQSFWRVRADAAFSLDPSQLPQVAAGAALDRELEETAQLQAEGRAARVVVDLRFRIVQATDTSATIFDDVENRSYFIDARTKQPIGPPPDSAQIYKMSYELQKIDGSWRVVDATRYPN